VLRRATAARRTTCGPHAPSAFTASLRAGALRSSAQPRGHLTRPHDRARQPAFAHPRASHAQPSARGPSPANGDRTGAARRDPISYRASRGEHPFGGTLDPPRPAGRFTARRADRADRVLCASPGRRALARRSNEPDALGIRRRLIGGLALVGDPHRNFRAPAQPNAPTHSSQVRFIRNGVKRATGVRPIRCGTAAPGCVAAQPPYSLSPRGERAGVRGESSKTQIAR
jgi:hypothetical protein